MKIEVYGRVYLVRCSTTRKRYVGQTIRPLAVRLRQHGRLWRGKTSALGAAIRRYGLAAFTIELLEECESRAALDAAEASWIVRLDCLAPNGYNLRPGGGSRAPQSMESRLRQSEAMRGRVLTPQHRQKISAALYRLPALPPDREARRRAAISAAMRRRDFSVEHRAAISRANRGQPCPLETRLKLLGTKRPGSGLSRPGEANPNARLTWARVGAIRLLAVESQPGRAGTDDDPDSGAHLPDRPGGCMETENQPATHHHNITVHVIITDTSPGGGLTCPALDRRRPEPWPTTPASGSGSASTAAPATTGSGRRWTRSTTTAST